MITLYDKQGQPVVFKDQAEAAAAVAAGTVGFSEPKARMVSPDGRSGAVPAAKAASALARGFRLETDAEAADHAQRAKAREAVDGMGALSSGLRGTASALSLGLTDAAEGLTADPYVRYNARLLKEDHGTARHVGEAVGMVGSLATGFGAPSLIAKAGKAAGSQVAAGVGRAAVSGVAEGTLYGLGSYISEESLSADPQLDAEKLLAAMGAGAVTGGVLSGGVSLAGSGLKKGASLLTSKLGGKSVQGMLDKLANEAAVRQFANKSEMKAAGLTSDEIQVVGDYGLKNKLFGLGAKETLTRASTKADEVWNQKLGKVLTQADKAGSFDVARFNARVQQELIDPLVGNPAREPEARILAKFLEEYQRYAPGGDLKKMSFSKAWELRSDVLAKAGFGGEHHGARGALKDLQGILREEIIDQADVAVPAMSGLLRTGAREYRNAATIRDIAEGHIERQVGNRWLSPSDMLAGIGGAALGGFAGAGMAAGAAVANHLGREYVGSLFAITAKKLAQSGVLTNAGTAFHKAVSNSLLTNPAWGGAFRGMLEQAAARGAQDLVSTHVALAKADPSYLAAMGMAPETGDEANGYVEKAARLGAVRDAIAQHDANMDRAIGRFFGKQGGRPPAADQLESRDATREKLAAITALAGRPEAMAAGLVPPDLANLAPGLAATMGATGMRAIQFLASVAPKPPRKDPLAALDDKNWEPGPAALARWGRYVSAIERPDKVIHALQDGSVSQEQVDALRAVYPRLLQDIQTRLTERLASWDKTLDYNRRVSLARLFGSPVGGAGDPQRRALIAQARQATLAGNAPQAGGDGRQEVSTAKNAQTQAQRIESRGTGT